MFSVERLGEAALAATIDAPSSLELQRRVWALSHAASAWPGVSDAVAGDGNLTIVFDPDGADAIALERLLRAAWNDGHALDTGSPSQFEFRAVFGGADGPDLEALARSCNASESEIVERFRASEFVVWFLGFVPGFAYLRGLDARLQVPRRTAPRTAVPAGSIAVAGPYAGVYPHSTPGGWHLIGRTEVTLFDASAERPALLAPGDRVRFV